MEKIKFRKNHRARMVMLLVLMLVGVSGAWGIGLSKEIALPATYTSGQGSWDAGTKILSWTEGHSNAIDVAAAQDLSDYMGITVDSQDLTAGATFRILLVSGSNTYQYVMNSAGVHQILFSDFKIDGNNTAISSDELKNAKIQMAGRYGGEGTRSVKINRLGLIKVKWWVNRQATIDPDELTTFGTSKSGNDFTYSYSWHEVRIFLDGSDANEIGSVIVNTNSGDWYTLGYMSDKGWCASLDEAKAKNAKLTEVRIFAKQLGTYNISSVVFTQPYEVKYSTSVSVPSGCEWWYTEGTKEDKIKETKKFAPGTKIVFHATDTGNDHQMINGWKTTNGTWLNWGASYTFESISEDISIEPEFKPCFRVFANAENGATATVNKTGKFFQKVEGLSFSTTIPSGYTFDGWYNGSSRLSGANPYSYGTYQPGNGTDDLTLTAKFVPNRQVTNITLNTSPQSVRIGEYFTMTVNHDSGFNNVRYKWDFGSDDYLYGWTPGSPIEKNENTVTLMGKAPAGGYVKVSVNADGCAETSKEFWSSAVTVTAIPKPTVSQVGKRIDFSFEKDYSNGKGGTVDTYIEYYIGSRDIANRIQEGFNDQPTQKDGSATATIADATNVGSKQIAPDTKLYVKTCIKYTDPEGTTRYASSDEVEYTVAVPLPTIDVNGTEREYVTYIPDGISGKVGVVISLHGASNDYDNGRVDFNTIADNEKNTDKKFVVIYPRGLMRQLRGTERGWDSYTENNTEDVDFFKAAVKDIDGKNGLTVDYSRIYLAGFSNGGMMAYKAAHQAGDFFKAFASVGGFPVNESHLYHAGVQPTPFIHIHGENDNVVRIHKDDEHPDDAVYDVNTIIHNMTYRNGASFNPNGQSDGGNVIPSAYNNDTYVKTREIHNAEDGGAAYYYYEIKGMWHDCSRDLNSDGKDDLIAQAMWNFFNKDNIVNNIDPTLKFRANDPDQFWNYAGVAGFTTYSNTQGTKTVFTYGDDTKTNENKNVYHSLQFKGVVGGTPHYLKLRINTSGAGESDYFIIKLTKKGQSAPVFIRRYQATAGDGDYFVNFNALNGWNEYKLTVERNRPDLDVRVNGVEFHSGSEVENEAFFPADLNNVLKGMNPIYQPVYGQTYDGVAKEYLPIATIPVPTESTPKAERTIEDVLAYTKDETTTTLTSIPSTLETVDGKLFINIAKSGKETTAQAAFKNKNAYILGTGYTTDTNNGIALSHFGPAGMPAYIAGSGDFPTKGVIAMKVQGTFNLKFLLYNQAGDTYGPANRKLKVYYTNDQLNGELKEWKDWDFYGTRNETNANGKNPLDIAVRLPHLGQDGTSTIFLTYEGSQTDDMVWLKGIIAHRPNLKVTIGRTDKLRYKRNEAGVIEKDQDGNEVAIHDNDKLTPFGENKPYQWNFGTASFSAIDPKTGNEAKKTNKYDGRTYVTGLGPNGEDLGDHLLVYSDGASENDKASFDGRPSNGRHSGYEDDLSDNNEHIEFNHPTTYSGTHASGAVQNGFDKDRRSFTPILSNGLKVNVTGSGWFTIACSAPNGPVNMKVLSSTNGGSTYINLLREFIVDTSKESNPETDWKTYRVYLKAHAEKKGDKGFWDGDYSDYDPNYGVTIPKVDPEDTQMSLYVVFDAIEGETYKDGETVADAQLNIHYLQWINEMPADYVFQREENPALLNSLQSIVEGGTAEKPGLYWQAGNDNMFEEKNSITPKLNTTASAHEYPSAFNSAGQQDRKNGQRSGDGFVSSEDRLACEWNVAAQAHSVAHTENAYYNQGKAYTDKLTNVYDVANAGSNLEFGIPISGSFFRFMPMKNQFISAWIVPENGETVKIYVLDETGMPIPYCPDADMQEGNIGKFGSDAQEARERGWVHKASGMSSFDTDKSFICDGTTALRLDFAALAGKEYFIVSNVGTISLARLLATEQSNRAAVEELNSELVLQDNGTGNASAIQTVMEAGIGRHATESKPIKLNGRTFAANTWASLVLPFSMNEKKLEEVFGVGTRCMHFTSVDKTNNVTKLTHHFYDMIVAGRPVFIRPTNTVTDPVFTDVTLQTSSVNNTTRNGGDFVFCGSYDKTTIKKNDLYLNTSNAIKYMTQDVPYPGMRAYIQNTGKYDFESGKDKDKPANGNAKIRILNFDDADEDFITGIDELITQEFGEDAIYVTKSTKIYNLNGILVGEGEDINSLPAGIYIVNGKKYVVRK